MDMPLLEAFHHIFLLKEKDEIDQKNNEMELFLKFQMMSHSHPLQTDDSQVKRNREEFVDMITPSFLKGKGKSNVNAHKWDAETERKIKEIEAQRKKEKEQNERI